MRIDDLSAPLGRFVAPVSASDTTVDCLPGLFVFHPPLTPLSVRTLRGRPGLCRSPSCSKDCRPALPSPEDHFTGRRSCRDYRSDRVCPFAAWQPGASETLAAFRPHLHSDARMNCRCCWHRAACYSYGFGPGGSRRLSVRRAITPPPVPRPLPPTSIVLTPSPVVSSGRTAPIPSDRDSAEPVRTPLLRLPPPTNVPPVTNTDMDALGAATEFHVGEPKERYLDADWAQEQQVKPACNAAMIYIALGRPEALPACLLRVFLLTALPFQRSRS